MSNLCIGIFRCVCIGLLGCVLVVFFCPTKQFFIIQKKSPLPMKGCTIWLILDTFVSSLACDTYCLTQPFACVSNVLTDFAHHGSAKMQTIKFVYWNGGSIWKGTCFLFPCYVLELEIKLGILDLFPMFIF